MLACCGLLAACSQAAAPAAGPADRPLPVDERVQLTAASGWPLSQSIDADLDGDGSPERTILAADVTVDRSGRPLWEDGHRWALFVEDGRQRTLLYSAFVPNGHVEAAVLLPDQGPGRSLLVVERGPQQSRVLVVAYAGPGAASGVSAETHRVEQWVPALSGSGR